MNNIKKWNIVGLILGVVLIAAGVVFMLTPSAVLDTERASLGGIEFGGDFYTEIYAEVKGIKANTWTTANNMHSLVESLALYFGGAFIMWGLLTIVHFGKALTLEKVEELKPEKVLEAEENTDPVF